jgi:hypothetical protein
VHCTTWKFGVSLCRKQWIRDYFACSRRQAGLWFAGSVWEPAKEKSEKIMLILSKKAVKSGKSC